MAGLAARLRDRLSQALQRLRADGDSATRRGKPDPYRRGEQIPLAHDVLTKLFAASPWLAENLARGIPAGTEMHLDDWGTRARVHAYGAKLTEIDGALERAASLIGKAHGLKAHESPNAYDLSGIVPASATLRAAALKSGPRHRPAVAQEVETHLLRLGTDPKDLVWHALGLWPPDHEWSSSDLIRPYVPNRR